ncbi:MAG: MFS transporter [Acholeplasmataceae bacterium]|jgi:MFS family permease|nr:MFS transporter [Acholeplasmataceae bacterium]
MRLNYKRTFYIGIVFFIISMFWQTYDMLIARTLIDKYGLTQTWSGIVMALDNIMAVFLLPLFGSLSDRSNAKIGRRTPYVIVGTIIAAFAFMGLAYADFIQTEKIKMTDIIETHYDVAFESVELEEEKTHWFIVIDNMRDERLDSLDEGYISLNQYESWYETTHDGMLSVLARASDQLSARQLYEIKDLYYGYLSTRAWEVTSRDPSTLIIFISTLFVALVAMAIFRSPAVALMPDITIKPLRSKANAIITFMGAVGGILGVYIIMLSGLNRHAYDNHALVFILIGIIMLLALGVFLWKVREPEWVKDRVELEKRLNIIIEEEEQKAPIRKQFSMKHLSRRKARSLYFLLTSIFMLFMGYNAVMSKLADYLPKVLNMNYFDFPFIVAQALVIIMIVPVGILSLKLGRRRTIILGMIIVILSFGAIYFLKERQAWQTAGIVFLAGVGWSMISINTYVMVVELASGGNSGLYTGYYYSASMTAQIATPILSGILMDRYGRLILFPYATLFVLLAFIAFLFVKEGEAKKIRKHLFKNLMMKRDSQ